MGKAIRTDLPYRAKNRILTNTFQAAERDESLSYYTFAPNIVAKTKCAIFQNEM